MSNCVSVERRPVIRFTAVCFCIVVCGENVFSGRVGFLAAAPLQAWMGESSGSASNASTSELLCLSCAFHATMAGWQLSRSTAGLPRKASQYDAGAAGGGGGGAATA